MDKAPQPSDLFDFSDRSHLPQTIAESIALIKAFALQAFDREATQKQLYYHTREHIANVQRRANLIFQTAYPLDPTRLTKTSSIDRQHLKLLLDLCVAAHDMVQVFVSPTPPQTARLRQSGVSEQATIDRLVQYIDRLNQQLPAHSPAILSDADIDTIRVAIATTTCVYNQPEQAIYQPRLYNHPSLSIVARILALADIGTLGIDGIAAYNREGSLLFLEENLDLLPLLSQRAIDLLAREDAARVENLRQRLLKRCRFQVSFAKSRLDRLEQELVGLPEATIPALRHDVFQYLTPAVIQTVAKLTPTADDAALADLLDFFQFEQYFKFGQYQ